jgi:hypothetical protein
MNIFPCGPVRVCTDSTQCTPETSDQAETMPAIRAPALLDTCASNVFRPELASSELWIYAFSVVAVYTVSSALMSLAETKKMDNNLPKQQHIFGSRCHTVRSPVSRAKTCQCNSCDIRTLPTKMAAQGKP